MREEAELEHQDSVSEPTEQMSVVDCQAFVQRLNCNRQMIRHTMLAGLDEIVIRSFSLNFWSSRRGHDSQFRSYWIKRVAEINFFKRTIEKVRVFDLILCLSFVIDGALCVRLSLIMECILVNKSPCLAYSRKDFDSIRSDLLVGALLINTEF